MNDLSWQTGLVLWGLGILAAWLVVEIIYAMRGPDDHEKERDWIAERRRRIQQRGHGNIWGRRN